MAHLGKSCISFCLRTQFPETFYNNRSNSSSMRSLAHISNIMLGNPVSISDNNSGVISHPPSTCYRSLPSSIHTIYSGLATLPHSADDRVARTLKLNIYLNGLSWRKMVKWTKSIEPKGPSTRVRFCVRIAVRFCAWFANKGFRVLIILRRPITTVCQHISGKIGWKYNCKPNHLVQKFVHGIIRRS
jgi:hypothetical protein